jgi:hypothetical protein
LDLALIHHQRRKNLQFLIPYMPAIYRLFSWCHAPKVKDKGQRDKERKAQRVKKLSNSHKIPKK